MKKIQRLWLVAGLSALGFSVVGCGSDPLSGTWVDSTSTPPADTSSFKITLNFQSGNKVTGTTVTVNENSAPAFPGCTRTAITNGTYKETTASSTVAVTYTSGTTQNTICLKRTDNDASPVTLPPSVLTQESGSFTYGVSGSTLTLTNSEGTSNFTK